MKIIQIMQAPKGLVATYNSMHEEGYYETAIDYVIAYGLCDTGKIVPLIIGDMGELEPIISNHVVVRYRFDEDKLKDLTGI